MSERLFVYGTLRRGAERPIEDEYPQARFVGTGFVSGVLWDLGSYPGIRLSGQAGPVLGDVYDLNAATLAALDRYEGEEYRRVPVAVDREDGARETCWIYELLGSPANQFPEIASGDWLSRG